MAEKKIQLSDLIRENYPEYYSIETYPADKTAPFCKIDAKWGIFSNFAQTPITVDGVLFDTPERLYQVMKFLDKDVRLQVYQKKGNPKMRARHLEKLGYRRPDWGKILVDAMKFCIAEKYRQSEEFRKALEESKGLYIAEDQTTFPRKSANTWGVKLSEDGLSYTGPNLMGRLLMELRDNGPLTCNLPPDAMDFSDLKGEQ